MSTPTQPASASPVDARGAIEANPLWYHTIELAPGHVTPGWFDLRPIVDRMPWPDVRGKRCLDVGTYDGFLAFELERRGAAEVVATDIHDHERWDWPPHKRAMGTQVLAAMGGADPGLGFRLAKEALSSSVEALDVSVYDLTPERVGTFDVVVCGSLLLHLRDPLRALEAIRGVCAGLFLSAETIELGLTLLHPRRPLTAVKAGDLLHWGIPNAAGHRQMLWVTGFQAERSSGLYCVPLGRSHPRRPRTPRSIGAAVALRALGGADGVPHQAVLARPRV